MINVFIMNIKIFDLVGAEGFSLLQSPSFPVSRSLAGRAGGGGGGGISEIPGGSLAPILMI